MSWFGDSISSLTGQLTNFTKEVLAEGRQEGSDASTSHVKTHEIEAQCIAQKKEVDITRAVNRELEERAHAAELQIDTLSKEYRNILQQKEDELASLKQKQLEMQALQEKILLDSKGGGGLPSPGYQGGGGGGGGGGSSCSGFSDMFEMEFGDVISSQHEINRLSDTVHRLRAERDHWRSVATVPSSSTPAHSLAKDDTQSDQGMVSERGTIQHLETKNKELERKLHLILDEHQRELTTLQDVYLEKLNQSKQSHRTQVSHLQAQVESLSPKVGSDGEETGEAATIRLRQECSQLNLSLQQTRSELEDVRGNLRERDRTVQLLGRQLEKLQIEKSESEHLLAERQTQIENFEKTIATFQASDADLRHQLNTTRKELRSHESLVNQLKSRESDDFQNVTTKLEAAEAKIAELLHEREQATNSEMLLEIQLARSKFANNSDSRQHKLLKEKQDLANKMAQLGLKDEEVQEKVDAMEEDQQTLSAKLKELIEQLGEPEHQQMIAGVLHALELENNILKDQNKSLLSQLQEMMQLSTKDGFNDTEDRSTVRESTPSVRSVEFLPTEYEHHRKLSEFEECETLSLMSSFSELSQRNKELDEQLKTLHSQIETYERDIEQFELVKADWHVEKLTLEQLLDKMRCQLRAKEASMTLVTAQRGLLEVKKQSPHKQKERAVSVSVSDLNFEDQLERLQEQIEELTESSVHLENERDLLLMEKDKLLDDLYKANKLNESIKSLDSDDTVKETAMRVQELEENVAAVTSERDSLMNSLEELDKQHQAAIEKILESRTDVQQKYKQAKEELEMTKASMEQLEKGNVEDLEASKANQSRDEVDRIALQELKSQLELQVKEGTKSMEILKNQNEALKKELEELEREKREVVEVMTHVLVNKSLVSDGDLTNMAICISKMLEEMENEVELLNSDKINLQKQLGNAIEMKNEFEKELDLAQQNVESLQSDLSKSQFERSGSLWKVESWEDIADDSVKNGKETLIKSTTKLQDLELESTSSKHSKDSSDDGQEKYGELVQRKEDLEVQVKDLESQVNKLLEEKEKLLIIVNTPRGMEGDDEIEKSKSMETETVDEKFKLLSEEKSKLEEELDITGQRIANYELTITRLHKEITSLKDEVERKSEGFTNESVAKISQLTSDLDEKNKQLAAMNDILKVYKENFEPEEENLKEYEAVNHSKLLEKKAEEIERLKEALNEAVKSKNDKENAWWTEEQHRSLQHEKEQILSILNEKSRENSSLKLEVHRLTNIVSAERVALDKLQQDNQQLMKQRDIGQAEANEMTKEAMHNLSRIIRDKDLEIEALTQKNNTLIAVLQQSPSTESNQLQTMLEEREKLTKQLGVYMGEREQIISALNQKHQESTAYHAEIQRLMSALYNEHQKFDQLQQQHSNIAKQYEDKQKTLVNTQNDLIVLKQRVTELEEQQLDLKGKYAQLLEKENDDTVETLTIPKVELKCKEEELTQLRASNQDKDRWIYEKDKLLLEHQHQIQLVHEEKNRKDEEAIALKKQIENLTLQMANFQNELSFQRRSCEAEQQKMENACDEANVLKETNSRLSLALQEKEFELTALREKVATLTQFVERQSQTDSSSSQEVKRMLAESEAMQKKAQEFQQERDQALVGLNQRQQENKHLQNELRNALERDQRYQLELERLRMHLLQVEEGYTQEAVHAEEREKELRNRLAQAEDRIRSATSSYSNASFQANMQVESLQKQLHTIAQQRDDTILKLDQAEDQKYQLTASLQTLQVVLEQFQQEKERELANVASQNEERLKGELRIQEQLRIQIQVLEQKLNEAKEALAAASRLSEKFDQREEIISSLKREVSDREAALKKVQLEMVRVASSTEGKVDRTIVKNLLVNYFSIPIRQQSQVLRIIATVLDFNYEERVKVGLESNQQSGWISSWLGQTSNQMTGAKQRVVPASQPSPSLSAAFIEFLETESRPAFSMKLPAESMAQEVKSKAAAAADSNKLVNPFTAAATVVTTTATASAIATNAYKISLESDTSHLLMKPMTATLPMFAPVPVSSAGTNILRDVLKQD